MSVYCKIQITIPTLFCKSQTLSPPGSWSFFNAKFTAFLMSIFVAFFFSSLVPFFRLSHYFAPPRVVLLFCPVIGGIHFASSPPWSHLYLFCRKKPRFSRGQCRDYGYVRSNIPSSFSINHSRIIEQADRDTHVGIRPQPRLSQSAGIIYNRYTPFAGLSTLPDAFGKSFGDPSSLLHARNMICIGRRTPCPDWDFCARLAACFVHPTGDFSSGYIMSPGSRTL
jgi:hypothetical protein